MDKAPSEQEPLAERRGKAFAELYVSRNGIPTVIELENGSRFVAFDYAWGRDFGDLYDHVSTNSSPPVEGRPFDFFYVNEVVRAVDPETGVVIYQRTD